MRHGNSNVKASPPVRGAVYFDVSRFLASPVNEIHTSVEEHCSAEDRELIVRELVRFNDGHAAPETYHDLVVLSRLDGALVGGLIGYTHWDWLFIKQLWVAATHRRHGVGRSLMRAAEHEAHARGCLHAHAPRVPLPA
ncbi:MAG: GNAT family N-acetyltransferase [Verrucomicrobiaceae bacterium]|nr:MAG: GNAT family N-acetyltransferase [Verrucomicrobiaceae bacterium]